LILILITVFFLTGCTETENHKEDPFANEYNELATIDADDNPDDNGLRTDSPVGDNGDAPGDIDLIQIILNYGLGEGEIRLIPLQEAVNAGYITEDAWGNSYIIFTDDLYQYTFYEKDNSLLSIRSNTEWDENFATINLLSDEEYVEIALELISLVLPAFNMDTTSILPTWDRADSNLDRLWLHLYDRQGNCLVNSGAVSLSRDGSLSFIMGGDNTIDDFKDSYIFSEYDIKNIVFDFLVSTEPKELLNLIYGEGYFSDDADNDNSSSQLPDFMLLIQSKDDLNFRILEKRVNHNRDIIWVAEVQAETSWGQVDDLFNFAFSFIIDAMTGDVLEILTF